MTPTDTPDIARYKELAHVLSVCHRPVDCAEIMDAASKAIYELCSLLTATPDQKAAMDAIFANYEFSKLFAQIIGGTPTHEQIKLLRQMMEVAAALQAPWKDISTAPKDGGPYAYYEPHLADKGYVPINFYYPREWQNFRPPFATMWANPQSLLPPQPPRELPAAQVPQWQPIETAPKDGTRILGLRLVPVRYGNGEKKPNMRTCWWDSTQGVWIFYKTPWSQDHDMPHLSYHPTHWQPLPQPPREGE